MGEPECAVVTDSRDKARPAVPVGVPGWRKAPCLGCNAKVVAARDGHALIGGTADRSFLMVLGAKLQRILTTGGKLPPDAEMFLFGAAHQVCASEALRRLEGALARSTDGLGILTAESGDHLPPLNYRLHLPVENDRCPFCDRLETLTEEHIWPIWFSRLLSEAGATLHGPGVSRGRIDITVPVCRTCNTTWMSVLENDTRGLLIRMLEAATGKVEPFELTRAEQTQLATWAVKTAYLIDALAEPAVPRGYLHELGLQRRPATSVAVWMAGFTPHGPAVAAKRSVDFPGRDGMPTTNSPNGFVVTFTILHVLFQVVGQFNDEQATVQDGRVQYAACLFPIWPTQPLVTWPPKVGFSNASWDDLHGSIGPPPRSAPADDSHGEPPDCDG